MRRATQVPFYIPRNKATAYGEDAFICFRRFKKIPYVPFLFALAAVVIFFALSIILHRVALGRVDG